MIDVDEVYKVPLNSSKISCGDDNTESKMMESGRGSDAKVDLTKTIDDLTLNDEDESQKNFVKNLNLYKSGRFNMYERHVNQMFIRGDNVVTIAFAD
jgi:small nuclear ribonucleoprotein (snRNP)-like protein